MKLAAIDFEYNRSKDEKLNLVCAAIRYNGKTKKYWLHKTSDFELDYDRLRADIKKLESRRVVFLAYAVIAEARSFLSMDLNPLNFTWVDLYLEYRQLTNHNHNYMYGKQLLNGKKKYTTPPKNKWEMTEEEEEEAQNSKPEHSMAAAAYKTLGIVIDTKFKTATRDLIISAPDKFTREEADQIMEYCASDVEYLEPMFKKMYYEFKRLLGRFFNWKQLVKDMKIRSEYACRSAIMESLGYPINYEMTRNFADSVPRILWSCQKEIVDLFPDRPPFRMTSSSKPFFSMHEAAVREYIDEWLKTQNKKTKWQQTEGGKSGIKQHSLSLKAFQKHFNFSHNFPKDNIFAQIVRYLKLKQHLNGFLPGGKTNFWDFVGSDQMVRPYMGIYGAQSSRSQPKASSFIPLKSAWMRCMIYPKSGYLMGSIDFASQEFLIAALLSGDEAMISAYESGDVYLAFGKAIGYIPEWGTKKTHKKERDDCKACIAEGTLIRTNKGLKEIQDITKDDLVWDGEAWRSTKGACFMGYKETIRLSDTLMTMDHKILTKDGNWEEAKNVKIENRRILQQPSYCWSDVWVLASSILYSFCRKNYKKWKGKENNS